MKEKKYKLKDRHTLEEEECRGCYFDINNECTFPGGPEKSNCWRDTKSIYVSDNTPTDTQHQITQLTIAMQTVLLEKNRRYGNSALEPLNTFSKLSNSDSIKIRLDDKLSRIKNSDEPRTNDVCDLIGYCFLLLISKGITEEEILNLID